MRRRGKSLQHALYTLFTLRNFCNAEKIFAGWAPMRAARSSVVIAVAGRVAREREGHRRGLGDVGLPGARGESGMRSHKDGRSAASAHEGSRDS